MIEALKDDKIINMAGGRFKLTALMQKRWLQLMNGARPMVDPAGKTDLEIITQEILEGKIVPDFAPPAPQAAVEETPSDTVTE
ncbi:MAG TPA: DNA-directed RNA polymerase subunit omega [Phycisphaerae bacterium]|nr:DNA-directed RNA polymerase subunit omega [Phycisphaerae bacterium]HRR84068.1 DNA-directed RNA polymerase subunit omega [Phycisphaerae bacterium]